MCFSMSNIILSIKTHILYGEWGMTIEYTGWKIISYLKFVAALQIIFGIEEVLRENYFFPSHEFPPLLSCIPKQIKPQ